MSGTGMTIIPLNATMDITTGSFKTLSVRTINNAGTVNFSSSQELRINDGAVFNNQPGATFDAQGGGNLNVTSGSGSFNNDGTFQRSAGTGTTPLPARGRTCMPG